MTESLPIYNFFLAGFANKGLTRKLNENLHPYLLFVCVLNSSVCRERYATRIGWFFSNIGIQGPIEERCRAFVEKGTKEIGWV